MPIIYNLELSVGRNDGSVPLDLYDASVKAFEEAGLIGQRHVNHFGRVFDGYVTSCDRFIEGHFDIFYRGGETRTTREILDEMEIKTSGFDDQMQSALAMGEESLRILEKEDPFVSLPLNLYKSMPFISSMEINTPAGIQNAHIHCEDGRIIQFWKPKKDLYWYDFDTFKDYITVFRLSSLNSLEGLFNTRSIKEELRRGLLRRREKLGAKAIENPDSVNKINWLNFL